MNIRKRMSVMFLCAAIACVMLASSSGAESGLTPESVESAAKKSDFVGSWSCQSSKSGELPGGQGQLVFTQKDDVVLTEDGTARSVGTVSLKVKVREIHARWDTKINGLWAIKDAQMCATLQEVSVTPSNDDARTFEEKKGSPLKDAFPTGQERCSEVVEQSRQTFAMKDAESGIITRCKRK